MFQKCPKCNGEGMIKSLEVNTAWKVGESLIVTVPSTCPLCLGEFVIHEEQGVPPSKVRTLVHFPDLKEEKDPEWTNKNPPDMPCRVKIGWFRELFEGPHCVGEKP